MVNAYTVNAAAFSVTDVPLDARTIPESYLLLRDVERVPYGLQFSDPDEVARRMSLDVAGGAHGERRRLGVRHERAGRLRSSGGVGVDGRDADQQSRGGATRPMPPAAITELVAAFLKKA